MNLRRLPSLPHWLIPSARARIAIIYRWRHGRWPDLAHPTRFTEHIQCRKYHDRDPAMVALSDKVGVKEHVRDRLGADWVIPTFWSGEALPERPSWPYPFILKARHGCNQNIVCHHPADWNGARRMAAQWIRKPYGLWLDEWAYRDVPRGYIIEPYLGARDGPPVDYKLYVFGGIATHVQVHEGRGRDHRWTLFDTRWQQVTRLNASDPPGPPSHLPAMLEAAATIARPFDFARVDFYEVAGPDGPRPLFGEVAFYPGSGLDPFDPVELDLALGALWPTTPATLADLPLEPTANPC
ncbi:MAG: ATP-grasp fold amidoligase family protein [Pontixanthobacter sp.]